MENLLNVVAFFSVVLIVWVLVSLRRSHIRVEHSVSWLAAATLLLILSQWRSADEVIARLLGVPDIPVALMVVVGAVFLVVLYRQSLRISGLKDSNIKLAQKIAILEYRLTYGQKPAE